MDRVALPFLEGLNEAQREVATHRGAPLLVFAAAGTGKTQALTARIAVPFARRISRLKSQRFLRLPRAFVSWAQICSRWMVSAQGCENTSTT